MTQYTAEQTKVLEIAAAHFASAKIARLTREPSDKDALMIVFPMYAQYSPDFWAELADSEAAEAETKYAEDCAIIKALWDIPERQVQDYAIARYVDEIGKAFEGYDCTP